MVIPHNSVFTVYVTKQFDAKHSGFDTFDSSMSYLCIAILWSFRLLIEPKYWCLQYTHYTVATNKKKKKKKKKKKEKRKEEGKKEQGPK